MYEHKPQLINIDNHQIPILLTSTTTKYPQMIGVQGLIQIKKNTNDPSTLRTLIKNNKYNILDVYERMTKKAVMDKSKQDYIKQCIALIKKYSDELDVHPKKVRQTPMLINKFGLTYKNKTITLNSYMRYMNDDIIENTIYHELCHVYTLENYGTMEHDEHFYDMLYKKYTKSENEAILQN